MELSGEFHGSTAFLPEKEPWYPLDRKLDGAQSLSERGGEEKTFLSPPRVEARSSSLQVL
jgi:hypothetical protein